MKSKELKNRLLLRLPDDEWEKAEPHIELKPMKIRESLYEPNRPIEHVHFVNEGIGSLIALVENDVLVEVGTVGNEGFVGVPVMLGAEQIPGLSFCQIPGSRYLMSANEFRRFMQELPTFRSLMYRYAESLFNQIAQNTACNRTHTVEERCARWLLQTHDRMQEDTFPLTQEFLGQMLGARRPTVNLAAAALQRAGYISYARGLITVTNREGLEAGACVCYRIVQDSMKNLFGEE